MILETSNITYVGTEQNSLQNFEIWQSWNEYHKQRPVLILHELEMLKVRHWKMIVLTIKRSCQNFNSAKLSDSLKESKIHKNFSDPFFFT